MVSKSVELTDVTLPLGLGKNDSRRGLGDVMGVEELEDGSLLNSPKFRGVFGDCCSESPVRGDS